jgi:NAD(P)-dependent dehydrogenase (short-subunit alcohol dehydrogenase family)
MLGNLKIKENETRRFMNLQQATVFVTGTNRGIGRALVDKLAQEGVKRIYAAARKPEELSGFDSNLVVPVKLDITNLEEAQAAAQLAGDTTILINNAGVLTGGSLLEAPLEQIARNFETNFYGTLNVIRTFAPVLEKNGGGAIANVLTVVSLASMAGLGGYSASKAAAFSLTQAVRADLRGKNITVHAVYPGPVDTDMASEITLPKTSPQDVAAAILEGIKNGAEDIFPDPMAQQISQVWGQNPKELEKMFASM